MNDDHSFQPDLGTIEQNPVENEEVRTAEEDKPAKEVTIADSSGGDKTFECQNCHTIFRASNPGETHCVYCGMQGLTVVEGQSFEGYQVLPFLETLNDAFSGYTKKTFFNPLIPLSFRKRSIKNRIRKLYVPCTLSNVTASGTVNFLGADRINNVKNSLMQTFESSYSTHFDYNNLLTSNYPLITDELLSNMGSMNFSVLKDFESMNVSGCSIINSNVEMNTLTEEAKEKVLKHAISIVRGNVQHEKKKLSSQDLKLELNSIHSVLIPIYYLKMKYKDKEYFFIMNGQTGDSIVTVPICASSIFLFCILCFAAIFGICYLIAHLM